MTARARGRCSIGFRYNHANVAAHDFVFALEFSSQGAPAALIHELAGHVLTYVGCSAADLPELTAALEHAVAAASVGQRRCDVQFRVNHPTLEIVVAANGGRVWQTSRPIPGAK